MGKRISDDTRRELLKVLRVRYRDAVRAEKGRILDEFTKVTGYHRKHALRLLNQAEEGRVAPRPVRRVYDEAVREALVVLWEVSDRVCSKRLKAMLPVLLEALEHHGHLKPDEEVRKKLLGVSAATIDRLLSETRKAVGRRKRRKSRATAAQKRVPLRTFADWDESAPGHFEADFVAHCGGSMAGQFLHTFMLTDVATGWTEGLPMLAREQSLVVEALTLLRERLPIPLLGLDTDNDSAFMNGTVIEYCEQHNIALTRSRPWHKNDQAWIEQKNGAVVRRLVGYDRHRGLAAARALGELLRVARLHVNFFQPSFKLKEKHRVGGRVTKRYFLPATPCDRMLAHPAVSGEAKRRLREERRTLDPIRLLKELRDAQASLAAIASGETQAEIDSFEEFLASLPKLWLEGEARPTHAPRPKPDRYWRTRSDPFADVWGEVCGWLEAEPDATATTLFHRLQDTYPGRYKPGQLRTLQRRVRGWRRSVARKLVGFCAAVPSSESALPPNAGGDQTRGDAALPSRTLPSPGSE